MVAAIHIGKITAAITVLSDRMGMTLVEAGFLLSIMQLAGMTLGVLIGVAADTVGLRRSVISGQLILTFASFAGLWARQPADLLVLRGFEGLGFLLVVLPAPSLIRQLVPFGQLARYLGLWGTYMASGTSLALLCAPFVMSLIGWSGLWVLLAALSLLMVLWLLAWVPSERQRQAHKPAGGMQTVAAGAWWATIRLTLSSKEPWRVALVFSMYSSQWLSVIGFLPAIYAQAGLSGQTAGALTALACFANVTGSVAAGRLLHRGVCARHLLYVGFVSMAVTTALAFGQWTQDAPTLRYLAVVLFSAIGGMIPGALFSLAVHVAPSERAVSTTVGWMQQCSSTGQFLAPPGVAWIAAQAGGWHWTWVATGCTSLIGLLLAKGVTFKAQK
jgi:cyanate permease